MWKMLVEPRGVGEQRDHRDLHRDPGDDQPVGEQADAADRLAVRAPRHDGADLREHDAGHRHRRRLEIEIAGVGQRLPRPPAGEHVREEEARHGRDALERADAGDPAERRAVEQVLGPRARRARHRPRLGTLRPQSHRGDLIGAEVDRDHLHDDQRQRHRAAGDAPHQERDELADVGGEVVADEAAHVVVDGAALLYGRDDRREVVVEQDEVGGLLGDVGAAAHRDADVGVLEGRRVVHAVAGHGHDLAGVPQDRREPQLLLGVDAREDDVAFAQPGPQLAVVDGRELGPGDHVRVPVDQADPAGDRLGGAAAVARDHDEPDPGAAAAADRVRHLGTRRVDHPDEAEELEIALDRIRVVAGVGGQHAPGTGEHAQRVALHRLLGRRRLRPRLCGQRRARQDELGGALDVRHAARRRRGGRWSCACARS